MTPSLISKTLSGLPGCWFIGTELLDPHTLKTTEEFIIIFYHRFTSSKAIISLEHEREGCECEGLRKGQKWNRV